ncbi:hypothetical protein GCM10007096_40950 [Pullulanibacillus pueri]|uniref:Uncharacterized protein n=1 Tax=Pullulanibacillus pueri TaxID=1437324 RepID=A0A8J3EPI9_9BACL|nr:hypothetical protein GCM10007096_40950 [Pullulanibacillus pueri]
MGTRQSAALRNTLSAPNLASSVPIHLLLKMHFGKKHFECQLNEDWALLSSFS